MNRSVVVLLFSLLVTPMVGASQQAPTPSSHTDPAVLLDEIEGVLRASYVFQNRIDAVLSHLRGQLESGAYSDWELEGALSQALTSDLIEVTRDQHFFVAYDPDWVATYRERDERIDEIRRDERAEEERINHGLVTSEVLEGNVGYVRLDYFANLEYAYESAAAAMRFVQNSDALIIDMRYNRGGHMDMAHFLTSYLFSPHQNQLLFEYVYADDGAERIDQQRVLPYVPGRRMPDVPVVVLTSSVSFSAGEWLAYALQKLNRARIVGQRTTGAANSVTRLPINDRFLIQVPTSLTRDPVDGDDFQEEGVAPDTEVPSHVALEVAHRMLLVELGEKDAGLDPEWYFPVLEARMHPVANPEAVIQRAAGRYEGREFIVEGGALMYRWLDRNSLRLTPLSDTLFAAEGATDWRFRLVLEDGEVTGIERVFMDGSLQRYAKLGSDF